MFEYVYHAQLAIVSLYLNGICTLFLILFHVISCSIFLRNFQTCHFKRPIEMKILREYEIDIAQPILN